MNFEFFYMLTEVQNPDDWRQKTIWHRTSTGQRNKIKIKSLPKDDQWKYAPLEVKLKRKGKDPQTQIAHPTYKKHQDVFTVYYSADRPKAYDEFEDGKLVVVTDDSAKAIEIEKKGYTIAVAHKVPMEAIKKFWNYDKKDWESFDDKITDKEKYELVKFSDDDVYLADFAKYKAEIDFQMSDPKAGAKDE